MAHHHHHHHTIVVCERGLALSAHGAIWASMALLFLLIIFAFQCSGDCYSIWGPNSSTNEAWMKALKAMHMTALLSCLVVIILWCYAACSLDYKGCTAVVVCTFVFNLILLLSTVAAFALSIHGYHKGGKHSHQGYPIIFGLTLCFVIITFGLACGFFCCADMNKKLTCC